MEAFYNLTVIFILWELLSLFGFHESFNKTLKEEVGDKDLALKNPGKALSLGLASIGYLIIGLGYIIWSIVGLFVSSPVIFIPLLTIGYVVGQVPKEKTKFKKVVVKIDAIISLGLLGFLMYAYLYGVTLPEIHQLF